MSLVQPLNYEVYFVREKPFPVLDYELYKLTERRQVVKTQVKIKSLLAKYPRLPLVTTSGDVTDKIVKRTNKFDLLMMAHHNPMGLVYRSETVDLMKKVKTPMLIT